MAAAVQPLLLSGDGQKHDRGGELQLAQDAGALQADGGAAGIVIGARGVALDVEGVAVARVVVAGDDDDVSGAFRVAALQDGVHIGNLRGAGDSPGGCFRKAVGLDLEAAAAILGVALKFRLDPFARGADAASGGDGRVILRRERGSGPEADQFFDAGPDALGRDLLQRGGDRWVRRRIGCARHAGKREND